MQNSRRNVMALSIILLTSSISSAACKPRAEILTQDNFSVQVARYKPTTTTQRTVLILPPTNGVNSIDEGYAEGLCKKGVKTYLLSSWTGMNDGASDLGLHDRQFARALKAISIAAQTAATDYVGILGTSLGGIYAAVAIGQLDFLDAAFVIVAGAPVAEIVAYSDQEKLQSLRVARAKDLNFSNQDEYLKLLNNAIQYDPLNVTTDLRTKKLGMVVATEDSTVPTSTQYQLLRFWQPEIVIKVRSSHGRAIFRTWVQHNRKIQKFFLN